MMGKLKLKLREESGVALATVIFVAGALTVLSTTAAAISIKEFRSGTEDRKAAEALSYAESGIDRMIEYLSGGGNVNFGLIRAAGCDGKDPIKLPDGKVGNGTFKVSIRVKDCASRPTDARGELLAVIRSEGSHPNARRVVEQVVKVDALGLPVGIAAEAINGNGTPGQVGISMISEGKIVGRGQLNFVGDDPWYTIKDFWPDYPGENRAIPSGAHAVGGIWLKNNGQDPEFTTTAPKNCAANKDTSNRQSLWDGDGSANNPARTITSDCAGGSGPHPPNSYFGADDYSRVAPKKLTAQDRLRLKQAAKTYGQYCYKGATTAASYCIRRGVQIPYTEDPGNLPSLVKNFVNYYEFESGDPLTNTITYNSAAVWGCDIANKDNTRSMVMVVERGGVDMQSSARVNGAFLLDGAFKYTGSPIINGTIVAKEFWFRGSATFMLDDCWVQQMPGPWLAIEPVHWSEVDR